MSKLTINYNKNYNFRLITMNAILSRVLPLTNLLWGQAVLVIYDNDRELYFTPNYLREYDYLKR